MNVAPTSKGLFELARNILLTFYIYTIISKCLLHVSTTGSVCIIIMNLCKHDVTKILQLDTLRYRNRLSKRKKDGKMCENLFSLRKA